MFKIIENGYKYDDGYDRFEETTLTVITNLITNNENSDFTHTIFNFDDNKIISFLLHELNRNKPNDLYSLAPILDSINILFRCTGLKAIETFCRADGVQSIEYLYKNDTYTKDLEYMAP